MPLTITRRRSPTEIGLSPRKQGRCCWARRSWPPECRARTRASTAFAAARSSSLRTVVHRPDETASGRRPRERESRSRQERERGGFVGLEASNTTPTFEDSERKRQSRAAQRGLSFRYLICWLCVHGTIPTTQPRLEAKVTRAQQVIGPYVNSYTCVIEQQYPRIYFASTRP